MGPAAVAQASYLLPLQEVQFLWHNGAQTVSGAKATTAVQSKRKYLGHNKKHTHYLTPPFMLTQCGTQNGTLHKWFTFCNLQCSFVTRNCTTNKANTNIGTETEQRNLTNAMHTKYKYAGTTTGLCKITWHDSVLPAVIVVCWHSSQKKNYSNCLAFVALSVQTHLIYVPNTLKEFDFLRYRVYKNRTDGHGHRLCGGIMKTMFTTMFYSGGGQPYAC